MPRGYLLSTGDILKSLMNEPMQTTVQLAREHDLTNHKTALILTDLRETGMVEQIGNSFKLTWEGMKLATS